MQTVSYTFKANDTASYVKLIALCLFGALLLFVLDLWWLFTLWPGDSISMMIGLSLPIVIPVIAFYVFRKRAVVDVTVVLSPTQLEIQWPDSKKVIPYSSIESYSATRIPQEDYDRERVRLKLTDGKEIKLTATSDLCDIQPMQTFREAFQYLAVRVGLEEKNTWAERILKAN